MPFLAYCIVEAATQVIVPKSGISGTPIETVSDTGLLCLTAAFNPSNAAGNVSVREAAIEYHHVLSEVFRQAAIIPFRFPTVLPDKTEVAAYLREHAEEFGETLARLRNLVQMEVMIGLRAPDSAAESAASGAEYLRQRKQHHDSLQLAAKRFHSELRDSVSEWRCRETTGMHCYALVERAEQHAFLERARAVELSSRYAVRITGPWPATEFLNQS